MGRSAGVVDGIRQETEIAGTLDRAYDARLLRARRARSARRFDLTDRREKASEDVETLEVDLLGLQLRRKLFAIHPGDDEWLLIEAWE